MATGIADSDYTYTTTGLPLSGNQPAGTKSAAERAATALNSDFNNFMKLLTTQLKNQDPTEPMDTNQMTQQLATFASVEQQVATNKNMEALLELLGGSQLDRVVSYIGKNVEGTGGLSELKDNQAYFSYESPGGVKQLIVSVVDKNNKVVFSADGDAAAGRHGLVWDGKNSFTGAKMPDGVYQLVVTALDSSGEPVKGAVAYTNGRVTAVESSPNGQGAILKLGNISLSLDNVTTVRDVPTNTPTPDPDDNSGGNEEEAA
jgi:flagellar basal-body rod modification protein FlgD